MNDTERLGVRACHELGLMWWAHAPLPACHWAVDDQQRYWLVWVPTGKRHTVRGMTVAHGLPTDGSVFGSVQMYDWNHSEGLRAPVAIESKVPVCGIIAVA